jgi:endonuclease/exonuclease/phosphatase family metal-dependent hydrolase
MRCRLAALLAALAALLGLATPAHAASTGATAATPVLRVMTFNICGNVCRHGEVTHTAANIATAIRTRNVAVAMLEEVCYSQFLGVRAALARYGYTAAFGHAAAGGHCDDADRRHGRAFGVALIAKGRLTGAAVRALPSPYDRTAERRVLLAASLRYGVRDLYLVAAHTAPGGPNLAAQLTALRRFVMPIAATRPVVLGGDLNTLPDNPGLTGLRSAFREADTRAVPLPTFRTVPRKIDYLFASQRFLTPIAAGTVLTRFSDHRMYLGTFG